MESCRKNRHAACKRGQLRLQTEKEFIRLEKEEPQKLGQGDTIPFEVHGVPFVRHRCGYASEGGLASGSFEVSFLKGFGLVPTACWHSHES